MSNNPKTGNPEIGKNIVINGINTNYIEAGSGDHLILIHGSGPGVTAFANWHGVIPTFADDYHVFAPDMVGFGYTDTPEHIKDFTLDFWVDHIVGFMDALGIEKADFIGNSYGGALTLALATRLPDRVGKIVLMGAAGLKFEMTKGLDDVWGYEPSEANMRGLMETFSSNASLITDAIVTSRYQASIRPGAQEAFSRLFPEPRQEKLDNLATPEEELKKLTHQTLIIHGREDVIVPIDVAYKFSSLIPNSELHVFGGCGHWTQIEKKERFLQVVEAFLKA